MRITGLLFDLDGTLINTIPLITQTFQRVFQFFDLPWENGEVLKTIGIPLKEVAEQYLPGRAEEFIEKYSLFQKEKQLDCIKLYPDTIEMLDFFKISGYPSGVVTSKRRASALADMDVTGVNKYIDITITVDDVSRPKPNPEPVVKALQLLNIKPENAIFAGDSWYDIIAGKQAGVTTVGVTWGMATREELEESNAEFVVDSWKDFVRVINSINKGKP